MNTNRAVISGASTRRRQNRSINTSLHIAPVPRACARYVCGYKPRRCYWHTAPAPCCKFSLKQQHDAFLFSLFPATRAPLPSSSTSTAHTCERLDTTLFVTGLLFSSLGSLHALCVFYALILFATWPTTPSEVFLLFVLVLRGLDNDGIT